MTTIENKTSQETYVELARIAQDSFDKRRSYEWKMHFGLWASIAAVVYAVATKEIEIFSSLCQARTIGAILWAMYFLHFVMVSYGHWQDKKRKHYFMEMAEGKVDTQIEKYTIKHFGRQFLWATPYLIFTALLIHFAIKIILSIQNN